MQAKKIRKTYHNIITINSMNSVYSISGWKMFILTASRPTYLMTPSDPVTSQLQARLPTTELEEMAKVF